MHRTTPDPELGALKMQRGVLIACGLVAGPALMDVVLAILFSMLNGPDSLSWVGATWHIPGVLLGFMTVIGLGLWIRKRVCE